MAVRAALGALLRLGVVVLTCCSLAGLRPIVRRRLTKPFLWANDLSLPYLRGVVQHSKTARLGPNGSFSPAARPPTSATNVSRGRSERIKVPCAPELASKPLQIASNRALSFVIFVIFFRYFYSTHRTNFSKFRCITRLYSKLHKGKGSPYRRT